MTLSEEALIYDRATTGAGAREGQIGGKERGPTKGYRGTRATAGEGEPKTQGRGVDERVERVRWRGKDLRFEPEPRRQERANQE